MGPGSSPGAGNSNYVYTTGNYDNINADLLPSTTLKRRRASLHRYPQLGAAKNWLIVLVLGITRTIYLFSLTYYSTVVN